ncbi:MAG: UxaA family hydrolase [Bacillota bacterium]|nr:UxaA family hydrolase [Bacillota bacterium]MDI7250603.1 UxaA family hydrolase [Bacillota bacterium]
MQHKFLVHEPGDSVGVAVADIKAGEKVTGVFLNDHQARVEVVAQQDIPLGHKIALVPVARGERVIKYGVVIGVAERAIAPGEHVHVHNLKSARWGK